jgi:DNA mismatch repair protein MutS
MLAFCRIKTQHLYPIQMTNTKDLHIEEEIIPLFDFTYNLYSGKAVRDIMIQPAGSMPAILQRQDILKGFIASKEIFKDYSFSRFNLSEIYDFLETFFAGSFSENKMRWKFMFSEKARDQKRGKLILLVRLFYKIHSSYFSRIDTRLFPAEYAADLEFIRNFFADFKLEHFESAFLKNKFRIGHMVELMGIITKKITTGEVASFWQKWFLFEAYLSISTGITRHGYTFPSFDETCFSLDGFYHPVLKNPVKNDLAVSNNVILLTGPNMSGKSTLLKAVSLCVYLGHTGLAVPASKATMPFFETISVAINLTDSIVSGYSHFMSEIVTLKNVLEEAAGSTKCFAVFDELFRGTNIEDALEISNTTIKGLVNFPNSLFFISTHLHQLKDMEEIKTNKISTCYIECGLTDDIPAFTYKLKNGWSDLKLGRILFEKEGLNKMLGS